MTELPCVLLEKRGQALWITLNRPDKRNALNQQVMDGLRAGYEAAHDDTQVRAIVITGAGDKAFCAGADLAPGTGFAVDFSKPRTDYADLLRMAQLSPLPSIAAINGTCMAGGMGLLAMTDMAIAADHANFGLPEVAVGVFPMQVLSLLQSMVAPRILREWCFTGAPFDAHTARAEGLLNHVVPKEELVNRTDALVAQLVNKSPTAMRRGKYAMRAMASMSFDEAICFAEGQIGLLTLTEDAREGFAAFNEKRKPVFTGR